MCFILLSLVSADLCPEPVIPNGEVRGEKGENLFFGEITCNIGYHLVGASKTIKCRHGVWSHKELPVCSGKNNVCNDQLLILNVNSCWYL